jgi:hypothetical protein
VDLISLLTKVTKLRSACRPAFMKRSRIWKHLDRADEHILKGQAHVKNQEKRVKALTSDGHQTKNAEATLKCFQELLGSMKKHRDLVREELIKGSLLLPILITSSKLAEKVTPNRKRTFRAP